jgi:two-component system response regulator
MSDNTVTLHTEPSHAQLRIAIYSDRPQLREDVHSAFSTSIAPDLPAVDVIDFATGPALIRALHNKELDLCVLDGETAPLGSMGLSYQINAEIDDHPPLLVLLQRRDDAWLSTWSKADAVYLLPVDPISLPRAAAALLRPEIGETSKISET